MQISTILLVDDDPNIHLLATMALERIGKWQVIEASSGVEGLTLAAQKQPDLILLDVMMPDLDGLSNFACLQEDSKTASIPVIFMTAKVQKEEMEEYIRLGAVGVIAKPFDPLRLSDEIRAMLSGFEQARQANNKHI